MYCWDITVGNNIRQQNIDAVTSMSSDTRLIKIESLEQTNDWSIFSKKNFKYLLTNYTDNGLVHVWKVFCDVCGWTFSDFHICISQIVAHYGVLYL